MPQSVTVGQGADARQIAVLAREGKGPPVVWLGGFRSDMRSTKAAALDAWAERAGRAFLRFDYCGHGESGGRLRGRHDLPLAGGRLAVIERYRHRAADPGRLVHGRLDRPSGRAAACGDASGLAPPGMVLIAPAVDFTERLMWERFPGGASGRAVEETGVYHRPSAYSDEPYPITRALIEDGRQPPAVRTADPDRLPGPYPAGNAGSRRALEHALQLVEHLPGDSVSLTLIKDGDHRLSRPEDLERLIAGDRGDRLRAKGGEP